MRLPKHGENHTQPSGNAKLAPWSLDPGTLLAPTTPLEGEKKKLKIKKQAFMCTEKLKSFSRHHFPRFPAPSRMGWMRWGITGGWEWGRRAQRARCKLPPRQQPTAWHSPESPTRGNPPGLSANAVAVLPPGGFALRKFVISLLASATRRLRSFG